LLLFLLIKPIISYNNISISFNSCNLKYFYRNKNTNLTNSLSVLSTAGWDRIFITTPRLFNGNPATLAWVPRNRAGVNFDTHKSPLLQVNKTSFYLYVEQYRAVSVWVWARKIRIRRIADARKCVREWFRNAFDLTLLYYDISTTPFTIIYYYYYYYCTIIVSAPHGILKLVLFLCAGLSQLGMAQRSVQRRSADFVDAQLFQPGVRVSGQGGQV